MSIIAKNLSTKKLGVSRPINRVMAPGEVIAFDDIEYDAVINTPKIWRLISEGLIAVEDTDPVPPGATDSLQGAYNNSATGDKTIEFASGAMNGIMYKDSSPAQGTSNPLFIITDNAGTLPPTPGPGPHSFPYFWVTEQGAAAAGQLVTGPTPVFGPAFIDSHFLSAGVNVDTPSDGKSLIGSIWFIVPTADTTNRVACDVALMGYEPLFNIDEIVGYLSYTGHITLTGPWTGVTKELHAFKADPTPGVGPTTLATAFYADMDTFSGGSATITDYAAFLAEGQAHYTNTIGTFYGLWVKDNYSGVGAINNKYGVKIEDLNGAMPKFAIHTGTGLVYHNDLVGIKTTDPKSELHVIKNGVAGTPGISGRTVATFQNTTTADDARVAIISDNANISALDFGDVDAQFRGAVKYNHSTEQMELQTEAADRLRLRLAGAEVVGGLFLPTTTTSSNLTMTDTDGVYTVFGTGGAGGIQVDLPSAANNRGRVVAVKKVDAGAGAVTVAGTGGDTVDGGTIPLGAQYNHTLVQSDGTSNWFVIG